MTPHFLLILQKLSQSLLLSPGPIFGASFTAGTSHISVTVLGGIVLFS